MVGAEHLGGVGAEREALRQGRVEHLLRTSSSVTTGVAAFAAAISAGAWRDSVSAMT